jgi:hypothetical protein
MLAILRQADWLDGPRLRRIALVFAVLAGAALAADFRQHTSAGLTDLAGEQLGRDFVNYWSGARLAAQGEAARVYDIAGFVRYERGQTAANANFKWYSYPPTALLLSLPLAELGFAAALAAWLLSGLLLCAALLARTLGWRMGLLAALATPAALINALWGQNGQFSAALLAGGILLLESRPLLAGLLFGLLCFKPHLAVLVPLALAAAGRWRSFGAAAATVAALSATVFLLGDDVWARFLHNAPINAGLLEHEDSIWHRMPTFFAAVRLAGGGIGLAYAAQGISALAAAWLTARIWRGGARLPVKAAALLFATFLVTPYAWDYDLVVLTFAAAWLTKDAARGGFLPWEKVILAGIIVMPLLFSPLAAASHFQAGPLMLWAALLSTARRAGVLASDALRGDEPEQQHRREQAQGVHLGRIA